jgi:Secretion system C-terminal sorting domain
LTKITILKLEPNFGSQKIYPMIRVFTSTLFLLFFTNVFAATITSKSGGNWNDPQSWNGGVPTVNDDVTISLGNIIDISAVIIGQDPARCKSLTINGTLNFTSSNLYIGNSYSSGGNGFVIVNGTLNLQGSYNNSFTINGMFKLNSGSTFNMYSGSLSVDGNDGTASGSIPSGQAIVDFTDIAPSNFNAVNGTIYVMNPHYTVGEPCIKGAQTFNLNGTVSFGNGNMPRGNNDYIISSTAKPIFQNFEIFFLSTTKKAIVENVVVKGAIGLNKGKLYNSGGANRIFLGGDLNIGSNSVIDGDIEFNGVFQQNINALFEGLNTITSALFNGNLTVNTPKRVKIKLDLELPVGKYLTFVNGKFDTNNKTLTLNELPVNPTAVNFISTFDLNSEIGTLKLKNIPASAATVFPVGYEMGEDFASYVPVTITPTLSTDFSVSAHPLVLSTTGFEKVTQQWDLSRSNASASADVSFQWNTIDEVGGFKRADCKAYHHNNTSWDAITPSTGTTTSAGLVHTKLASGVNLFSPFTILSPSALPVELVEFKAKAVGNNALLTWSTATEYNNRGFNIEKSLDGNTFNTVGFVKGNGNSNILLNYNFTDKDFTQTAFYRLKQEDFDGKIDYSRIVQLEKTKTSKFKVYPNPLLKNAPLSIEYVSEGNEAIDVTISDVSGRIIFQNKYDNTSNLMTIPTQDLARGVYFVKVQNGLNVNIQKVVKE